MSQTHLMYLLRLARVEEGWLSSGYVAGMEPNRRLRAQRLIGAIVGGGLIILGVAELVVRLDEPGSLLFWLPTLWGGGALVLLGVFGNGGNARRSAVLVAERLEIFERACGHRTGGLFDRP